MGKHKGLSGFLHKLRGKKDPESKTSPSQATSIVSESSTSINAEPRALSDKAAPAPALEKSAAPQPEVSIVKPPIESHPVESPPVESPSVESISKKLWQDAYDKLTKDEEKLVVVYEKVLSQQLVPAETEVDVTIETQNVFADQKFDDKIAHMEKITQQSMERATRHTKIQQGAGEALQIINSLTPIINLAMGTNPVASVAWAGISAALPMLIRPLVAGKAMADGLTYVIQRMNIYFDFVHVLLQKQDETDSVQKDRLRAALTSKIGDLYTALLRYEMQCVCYCYDTHPAVKAVRAMITLDDFEARLNGLKVLESGVERDIGYFAISHSIEVPSMLKSTNHQLEDMSQRLKALSDAQSMALQEKEAAAKEKQTRAQKELTGKFKIEDYELVRARLPERVPGTCEWIRRHEKIQTWLEKQASLLVISAGPGCGKSTLAKYFIEDVLPEHDPSATIAYFFFRENEGHRSVAVALSSLLHKVFCENHELVVELEDEIKTKVPEGSQKWNISGMKEILSEVCRLNKRSRIICVVDALDECDPKELSALGDQLLEAIQYPYDEDHPKINFLATTRGYPEIMELFEDKTNCIHLSADSAAESDQIQHDIGLVLDYKVERMRNGTLSDDRKEMIKNALLDRSSGQRTYLWLDLVFQVLDRNFNNKASAWERLIHNPPKDVNKAYENLLRRVNDTERVRLLLNLIVAAERPLSLRELNVALEMHDSEGEILETELELEPDEDFKKWIIYECGFFLRIYNEQVFLIHQTAREFLLADGPNPSRNDSEAVWHHSTTTTQAHRAMARCCMKYINQIGYAGFDEPYEKFETSENWFWGHQENIYVEGVGQYYNTDISGCDSEFLYTNEDDWTNYQQHMSLRQWLEYKPGKLGFKFLPYSLQYWKQHCGHSQAKQRGSVDDTSHELFPLYWTLFNQSPRSRGPPLWYRMSGSLSMFSNGLNDAIDPSAQEWPEQHMAAVLCAISYVHPHMLLAILENYQQRPAIWEGHHHEVIRHAVSADSVECFNILLDRGFLEKSEEGTFATCLRIVCEDDKLLQLESLLGHGRQHGYLESVRSDGSLEEHILSAFDQDRLPLVQMLVKVLGPETDLDLLLKEPLLLAIEKADLAMMDLVLGYGVTPDSSAISKCFNAVPCQFSAYDDILSWPDQDLLYNKLLDIGLEPTLDSLSHVEEHIKLFYVRKLDEDAQSSVKCRTTLDRWVTRMLPKMSSFDALETRRIVALAALCPVEPMPSLAHLEDEPADLKDSDVLNNPSFIAAYGRSLTKKLADANIDLCFEWTPLMLPTKSRAFWNFAFFLKAGAQVDDWMVQTAATSPSGLPMALLFSLDKVGTFDSFRFCWEDSRTILDYAPSSWDFRYQDRNAIDGFNNCVEGDSLLHIACRAGSLYMVRLLLESGASIHAQNNNGDFPLHVAMLSADKIRLLFEYGADPNCRNSKKRTPLHWPIFVDTHIKELDSPVCSEEALWGMKELVQRKANIEARDEDGFTPLISMFWYHAPEQLKLLLEELGKVDGALDEPRSTFIPMACFYSNSQAEDRHYPKAYNCLSTLIQFGCDVNAQDENGLTGLHHVCKGPQLGIGKDLVIQSVQQLISAKADSNIKDSTRRTPLHTLAFVQDYGFDASIAREAFKILVDAGANVNCMDDNGQTPLHVAALGATPGKIRDVSQMIATLVELGARINIEDNLGRSPRQLLHENGLQGQYDESDLEEVETLFRKHGADDCKCVVCNPAMPVELFRSFESEE